MRTATATLITLGLMSLSCDVFQDTPAVHRGVQAEPAAQWTNTHDVPSHSALASQRTQRAPRGLLGATQSAVLESSATGDAIDSAQILDELKNRHTALSDGELVRLAETIIVEARRHELDPSLVLAVIQVESRGYHLAVSPVGALGLMQLLPSTAEELARKHGHTWRGANSLFDPILNVKLGTAYLSQLSNKYGSVSTALAAYNWGPGRIDRRLRRGGSLPRIYIEQVMKFYDEGAKLASASSS